MAVHRHAALLSLVLAACGPGKLPSDPEGEESSSSTSSSSSTESTTTAETSTTGPSETFVPEYDVPILSTCDVFAQDCPDGEKCVPYSSTGGSWDGFKCVPLTGNQAPGEPCVYDGPAVATDNCDENGGCWNLQEIDGEAVGICHAFCMGAADDPECPAGSACLISSQGSLGYCIYFCDPVAQDCDPAAGCYWTGGDFSCVSSSVNIPAGEPCEFINDCAPGLLCATAEMLPACNGSSCCTPFCILGLGDTQCETVPGTACVAFYEEGSAPPGYEDTGVCVVPAP